MAQMRAQLSLQFSDADLFNNFIKPYKEEKLLNSLIIKCLSAYYYDENVRNVIEGTSLNEVADSDQISSTQELCNSIRESLMMQDFMAQELKNTVDTGTEDVENILNKTNRMAEDTGVAKPTAEPVGLLQINKDILNAAPQQGEAAGGVDDIRHTLSVLVSAVKSLASAQGNSDVMTMFGEQASNSTPEPAKPTATGVVQDDFDIAEPEPVVITSTQSVTTHQVEEVEDSDASADMSAFLDSLT